MDPVSRASFPRLDRQQGRRAMGQPPEEAGDAQDQDRYAGRDMEPENGAGQHVVQKS